LIRFFLSRFLWSFQRKLESSFCFFFWAFKSKGFRSPAGRAGYFLCSCRESNQRDTPQSIAPFVHPARRVRDIGRVPLMAHPCATAECARSIAHTPLGPDRPLPPQCNGDPEKQEQRAPARRSEVQKLSTPLLLILESASDAARAGRKSSQARARKNERTRSEKIEDWIPASARITSKAAAVIALTIAGLLGTSQTRAQGDETQRTAQEAQAKQKLDTVRAEIKKIVDAQKETTAKKDEAVVALRDQDMKVAATAKELHTIDQKLAGQQDKLSQLERQRDALNVKLAAQRETLAALLRSAYAIGRGEELKLLLAQDDVAKIGRLLEYFHYFEQARVDQISVLLKDLDALAQVRKSIDAETAQLTATRAQRADDAAQLDTDRAQRAQVLADLDAQLKDDQTRLAALGQNEKELADLLAKLRDVFADIPKQLAGAEPFASQRGRLNWPVRGKLVSGFGAKSGESTSNGLVIAAPNGTEVHAVSHGRVVFADWMRGFGMLLIVDHGDGYLSLYGYNETLLKDVGDWVDANEAIATSGATGGQKTPGVYFELRAQGKPVDPRAWLKP
jgi:septal ring factor EnvC (AmiA/AmiB activator)